MWLDGRFFLFQECGHGWTSMKGRVIFWFQLNYATNMGYVMFKLYGQQCQRCKNGKYEHAMWYPEEVIKVGIWIYKESKLKDQCILNDFSLVLTILITGK